MAILWCGGEDIDFAGLINVSAGNRCRSNYARCSLRNSGNAAPIKAAQTFTPQTSLWLSVQANSNGPGNSELGIGLVNSATVASGIWIGSASSNGSKLALFKYNGTTKTQLAAETGVSFGGSAAMLKLDLQVISYGASATLNLYLNGSLLITYTGDVTVAGVANLDCLGIYQDGGSGNYFVSEIIVADEDTRLLSLATLAPNAAGTTDQWTGAYSDVNETAVNDSTVIYTNADAQVEQFNLSDLPSGSFTVKAVRLAARACCSAGATASKVALGIKSGAGVDDGTLQTQTTSWANIHRLMTQNPVTANNFLQSEMNSLQLSLKSGV